MHKDLGLVIVNVFELVFCRSSFFLFVCTLQNRAITIDQFAPTNTQTNGRYQTHYLSASWSIITTTGIAC